MNNKYPLRLALIGAGIFARDAHIPAINALGRQTIEIKTIYSRTIESASTCAALIPYPVDTTTDLAAVLARQDIDAVDVLLPIGIAGSIVRAALEAGKHVISEKPVATEMEKGRELIALYRDFKDLVWMVGENHRYNDILLKTAALVRQGEIGVPLMANLFVSEPFNDDNKYYFTAWRRDDSFRGGAIMDAGVHIAAGMRLVLGEIEHVSAIATKTRPDLPSLNTLCSTLTFTNGCIGTLSVTYTSKEPLGPQFLIFGENGVIVVTQDQIHLKIGGVTTILDFPNLNDVQAELDAFAAAVCKGSAHRNSPEQALQDVAVIDALLRSAETGDSMAVEQVPSL